MKLTRKGRDAGDATKNFQSMKAVALQETRHVESVPVATNVKTHPTFVSSASEKSMKMYKELTNYDRNSFLIKVLFKLISFELFILAKTCGEH